MNIEELVKITEVQHPAADYFEVTAELTFVGRGRETYRREGKEVATKEAVRSLFTVMKELVKDYKPPVPKEQPNPPIGDF